MTSGEVLFILAFIVLPTAVLVSSVWAVIFVRRRPDRVAAPRQGESHPQPEASDPSTEDTILIATAPPARHERFETAVATAMDRPDDTPHDPEPLVGPPVPEPVAATAADDAPDLLESVVVQTTEDLHELATRLSELDLSRSDEPETDPAPEEESPAAPDDLEPPDTSEQFHETSELPVVEPPGDPSRPPSRNERPETDGSAPASRWRRKPPVKLRPAEHDGPRQRGRNRDQQRQVPQLGRFSRRTDSGAPRGPANPTTDRDVPSPDKG